MRSRKRVNNVGIVLHVCVVLSESFIVSLAISLSINILMHVTCVITARTFLWCLSDRSFRIDYFCSRGSSVRPVRSLHPSLSKRISGCLSSPMNFLFSTSGCIRFLEIDLRFRVPRKQRLDAQSNAACSPAREFDLEDLAMLIKLILTPLNRQTSVAVNTKTLFSRRTHLITRMRFLRRALSIFQLTLNFLCTFNPRAR